LQGLIIKSTGSWYEVILDDKTIVQARIVGKLRLDDLKSTNPLSVGDRVVLSQSVGNDYNIKEVVDRKNYVVRQSPRKKHSVHLIASNVDQAILIATIIDPRVKIGFIDRFLLMTEPYDIPVTIVFNKSDLYAEDENAYFEYLSELYTSIGYTVMKTSIVTGENLAQLKSVLKDKTSLISGQSGVGKSSLINTLDSNLILRTGEISDFSGKGQHTTTFAEMFPLEEGGYIIDTPGIKTLAFNNLEVMDVAHNFKEFFIKSGECKFGNCTHRNEPACAVKKAIEDGEFYGERYQNYLAIIDEIENQNYWEVHNDI
jgi:ribosome biogenesis GTPase / thiamine phosphate phosphatase